MFCVLCAVLLNLLSFLDFHTHTRAHRHTHTRTRACSSLERLQPSNPTTILSNKYTRRDAGSVILVASCTLDRVCGAVGGLWQCEHTTGTAAQPEAIEDVSCNLITTFLHTCCLAFFLACLLACLFAWWLIVWFGDGAARILACCSWVPVWSWVCVLG